MLKMYHQSSITHYTSFQTRYFSAMQLRNICIYFASFLETTKKWK